MPYYFEAHLTLQPVFDARLARLTEICEAHRFRVADLILRKSVRDAPKRHDEDSFCTGRGKDRDELEARMFRLCDALEAEDFQVWRYKIEDVVLDSRVDDSRRKLRTGRSESW